MAGRPGRPPVDDAGRKAINLRGLGTGSHVNQSYPSEQAHLDFCGVDKCEVYRLADQAAGVSRLTC
jgi:hypothetical protein